MDALGKNIMAPDLTFGGQGKTTFKSHDKHTRSVPSNFGIELGQCDLWSSGHVMDYTGIQTHSP
jgi:hypothetical protein